MGYFIKKRTREMEGLVLPSGPTNKRPATPVQAAIRYNTDTSTVEYFNGSNFIDLAKSGNALSQLDVFTGIDTIATYGPLTLPVSDSRYVVVFINGIYQTPVLDFTISGTNIVFSSAVPAGERIVVIHGLSNTLVDTSDAFDVPNII
jgi:hypothetical protein